MDSSVIFISNKLNVDIIFLLFSLFYKQLISDTISTCVTPWPRPRPHSNAAIAACRIQVLLLLLTSKSGSSVAVAVNSLMDGSSFSSVPFMPFGVFNRTSSHKHKRHLMPHRHVFYGLSYSFHFFYSFHSFCASSFLSAVSFSIQHILLHISLRDAHLLEH